MKMKIKLLTGLVLLTGALTAADTAAGKAAYDRACKSCHGLDGTANEKIAAAMKVEMRPLGSKEVQGLSDAALKTVFGGKSSVNMFEMTKLVSKHVK